MTGKVLHLHSKPKTPGEFGLRKPAVESAQITSTGLEGDYNDYRTTKKDGHPDMALLVMPAEMLDELKGEGWPVEAGDIGENIVTEGIPYNALLPDVKFKLGSAVIQISYECDPCYKLPRARVCENNDGQTGVVRPRAGSRRSFSGQRLRRG